MTASAVFAKDISLPDKTHRAYSVIIEAGAKLLEFDIIRGNLKIQEKQIVALADKEKYSSSVGKAISALLPIEQLAPGFDELVPTFIALQNGLINNREDKTDQTEALKGLVAMLESPELFHMILPLPKYINKGYNEAMSYQPTLEFIKAIQRIVHRRFLMHHCDDANNVSIEQKLSPEVDLFYDVMRHAVINVFRDFLNQESKEVKIDERMIINKHDVIAIKCNEVGYQISKSLEWNDLQKQVDEVEKVHAAKMDTYAIKLDVCEKDYNIKVKTVLKSSNYGVNGNVLGNHKNNYINEREHLFKEIRAIEAERMVAIIALKKQQDLVVQKLREIMTPIAKRLGASRIVIMSENMFLSSPCDITCEAIAELNESYQLAKRNNSMGLHE